MTMIDGVLTHSILVGRSARLAVVDPVAALAIVFYDAREAQSALRRAAA